MMNTNLNTMGFHQIQQCRQTTEQLIQQTRQGNQVYQQMLQQEQQNIQMLEQLLQRERQAVQTIQQSLHGHDLAIQKCQQVLTLCNQLEQELANQRVYGNQVQSNFIPASYHSPTATHFQQ